MNIATPVDADVAAALAVWLGQIFTHLNDEQVREFRELFLESGSDKETIERAVRRYSRTYQYATLPGIGDAIIGQRRIDEAARAAADKRLADEAAFERRIDARIADMSPGELDEVLVELFGDKSALAANLKRETLGRMAAKARANPAGSGIIRARIRSILIAEDEANHEQPRADADVKQLPGPASL